VHNSRRSTISTVGLYQYGARWMDPTIAHFTQPDTMIPDLSDPLAWNRYSYANYNPIRYTDPTGHWVETALDIAFIGYDIYDISKNGLNWENGLSLTADVVGAILPVVTGGGLAVRAVMHADDVVDAVKLRDKAVDAVKAADKLDDAVDVIKAAGDICSFSSDTLITTSEGMEPISQIEEGDWVLAFDELSEDTGYFPVVARWEHKDLWTVELTIDGEVVETTPEHPFFVFEHGWVAAGDLWQGAQIIEADGELGIVEDAWIVYRPQSMYNLTVAEAHTYFVGNQQMLVHNACPIRKPTDSHHLIPNSAKDHDIIQYASSGGWEHNAPYNRMELPNSPQTAMNTGLPVHRGYNTPHRTYNSNMEKTLDRMWKASLQAGWTPTRAKQELFKLASRTRFNIWQSGKLIAK